MKAGVVVDIVRITNRHPNFYVMLGPFLARREIEKEIGYRIYDDDNKTWLVAVENDQVCGFCYLLKGKDSSTIGSCYVLDEYRNKGVFGSLLSEATKEPGAYRMVTKNEQLQSLLVRNTFVRVKEKGRFVEYTKEVSEDAKSSI